MEKTKVIDRLNDLIKLDMDAVASYEEAITEINLESVRWQLKEYQNDHRQHVTRLTAAVRALGGEPAERGSLKGFFLKQITAITARMGNEAAIRAMQANEKLINSMYSKATHEDWPSDLKALVESNYHDEQRHLSYLQQCVRDQVWEQPGAHP